MDELHGWYSREQGRITGSVLYRTKLGGLVEVTEVRANESNPAWPDAKYVGVVTEYAEVATRQDKT